MENLKFGQVSYQGLFQNLTACWPGGHKVGLTGPNGCGKTTLLRLLAGWLPWQRGQLSVGGRDQLELPPEKKALTFLPAQPGLYGHWTVRENIAFPARSLAVEDHSGALLEEFHLENLADRKARHLSQGERQRVAWARVLNRPAQWILADEAMNHLDGPQRHAVWQALGRRLPGGLLLVTHQLRQDLPWLDSLSYLEKGQLHVVDLLELEQNPRSEWLAQQLAPENVWSGQSLGWAPGPWWVPVRAWRVGQPGLPTRWLEARGEQWKVEVAGRIIWLSGLPSGENLSPDRELSVFLEASTPS